MRNEGLLSWQVSCCCSRFSIFGAIAASQEFGGTSLAYMRKLVLTSMHLRKPSLALFFCQTSLILENQDQDIPHFDRVESGLFIIINVLQNYYKKGSLPRRSLLCPSHATSGVLW